MGMKMLGDVFYKWKAVKDVQLGESFGRWAKLRDVLRVIRTSRFVALG